MDGSLRREIIAKLLAMIDMTAAEFTEKLYNDSGEYLPGKLSNFTYANVQSMLDIADEYELPDNFEYDEVDVYELIDLMELVEIETLEEGQDGPHGHGSWRLYYVE